MLTADSLSLSGVMRGLQLEGVELLQSAGEENKEPCNSCQQYFRECHKDQEINSAKKSLMIQQGAKGISCVLGTSDGISGKMFSTKRSVQHWNRLPGNMGNLEDFQELA